MNIDLGSLSYAENWFVTPDGQTLAFKNNYAPHHVATAQWSQNGPNGQPGWITLTDVSTQLGQTWSDQPSITPDKQWLYYNGDTSSNPGVTKLLLSVCLAGEANGVPDSELRPWDTIPWKSTPYFDSTTSRLYFSGGSGQQRRHLRPVLFEL